MPIDITAAHDNNRALIALEHTQDTFELMSCAKHKHMATHINMFFPLAHRLGRILENIDDDADKEHRKNNVARQEPLPAKRLFAKHP